MNKWPDEALERDMIADTDAVMASYEVHHTTASSADCASHVKALLSRVRELEKREAELTELLKKTDVLFDQLEASDELSESYEAGIAEVHLPIIVSLKGTP